jgi:hypothetical protein
MVCGCVGPKGTDALLGDSKVYLATIVTCIVSEDLPCTAPRVPLAAPLVVPNWLEQELGRENVDGGFVPGIHRPDVGFEREIRPRGPGSRDDAVERRDDVQPGPTHAEGSTDLSRHAVQEANSEARAQTALAVLRDPAWQGLRTWARAVAEGDASKARRFEIQSREATQLAHAVQVAAQHDGFEHLERTAASVAGQYVTDLGELNTTEARTALQHVEQGTWRQLGPEERKAIPQDVRRLATRAVAALELCSAARFVQGYVLAYVRGTPLVSVTVNLRSLAERLNRDVVNASGMDVTVAREAIESMYRRAFRRVLGLADQAHLEEYVQFAVDGQYDMLEGKFGFGLDRATDAPGFVARGGDVLRFRTIEVGLDASRATLAVHNLDLKLTGNELLRVVLEALLDYELRVPGVPGSTGTELGCADALARYDVTVHGREDESHHVTPEEFGRVNAESARAEAAAAAVFSKLVRGGGPLALNNEALAGLLETLVSVGVRKSAERVLWCWYCARPSPVLPSKEGASPAQEAQGKWHADAAAAEGVRMSLIETSILVR